MGTQEVRASTQAKVVVKPLTQVGAVLVLPGGQRPAATALKQTVLQR